MIFHINLKIVKTFLSVFLFSQFNILYFNDFLFCNYTLSKMNLNLKQQQKRNAKKKDGFFCVLIIYCTFFPYSPISDCNSTSTRFACIHSRHLAPSRNRR